MRAAVAGYRGAQLRRFIPPLPTVGLISRLVADTGLTVDGSNKVSAWADQTGLGNGAVQPTASNQPTLGTDYLGRPVVQFLTDQTASENDSLDLATARTFDARNVAVFAAVRIPYGANSTIFALSNYAGTTAHLRFASAASTTAPQTLYSTGRNSLITPDMHPTVISMVSGATVALSLGPDVITGLGANTADTDCLGATIGRFGTTNFQTMDLYEFLVYDTATVDAAAVRAHLAAKYQTRTTPWTLNAVFEGDSITQGVAETFNRGYPSRVLRSSTATWRQTNIGSTGATVATLSGRAGACDGYKQTGARNVLTVLIGRNDAGEASATGLSIYNNLVPYVQARVAAGWEVWVGTCIATGSSLQPILDDLNARIRAGIIADAGATKVIDYGALPQFDTTEDSANTTYYRGDATHPSATGAQALADLHASHLAAA